MVNDFGAGVFLETALPGGDERGSGDDFAGDVDRADVAENFAGNLVLGIVGHGLINALFAGISNG